MVFFCVCDIVSVNYDSFSRPILRVKLPLHLRVHPSRGYRGSHPTISEARFLPQDFLLTLYGFAHCTLCTVCIWNGWHYKIWSSWRSLLLMQCEQQLPSADQSRCLELCAQLAENLPATVVRVNGPNTGDFWEGGHHKNKGLTEEVTPFWAWEWPEMDHTRNVFQSYESTKQLFGIGWMHFNNFFNGRSYSWRKLANSAHRPAATVTLVQSTWALLHCHSRAQDPSVGLGILVVS